VDRKYFRPASSPFRHLGFSEPPPNLFVDIAPPGVLSPQILIDIHSLGLALADQCRRALWHLTYAS